MINTCSCNLYVTYFAFYKKSATFIYTVRVRYLILPEQNRALHQAWHLSTYSKFNSLPENKYKNLTLIHSLLVPKPIALTPKPHS